MESYGIISKNHFIKSILSTIFASSKINNKLKQINMNKSQTQKAFIAALPEGTTKESAWELFIAQYGENFGVRRGDFNHVFKLITSGEIEVKIENTVEQTVKHTVIEPTIVKIDKMSDLKATIDPSYLIPLKTNTKLDDLLSKRGGAMPGTVTMITGESGAGKTTVSTNVAEMIKLNNPGKTTGFISGEMDQLDWYEECADNKMLEDLETIFLLEYLDAPDFMTILEQSLSKWNFCVVDSFEAILDQIKEATGLTGRKAEAEFIKLLRKIAREQGVAFFVIQQYTKGGTYVGSTKIKHLTTSMVYVRFDENGNRYVVYEKNRRNGSIVNKKLYFTKNKITGLIEFDNNKFDNERAMEDFQQAEKAHLSTEGELFTSLLSTPVVNEEFNNKMFDVEIPNNQQVAAQN